jgi:hypothetical protein
VLDYLSTLSILIPLGASLYKYRLLTAELKVLSWLFIFASTVEVINFIQFRSGINNLWIINIYVLVEGAIYLYVIGRWFDSVKLFRLTMALFAAYFIVWACTVFVSHGFFELNNQEKTLKGILLIILSGYLLIRISMEDSITMTQDFRFWILSAMLIYFSLTEVIFATASFVLENQPAVHYAWAFHSIINIISNLLFAIGFACSYRKMNFSG